MTVTVEVTATNIAGNDSATSLPVTITQPLPIPTVWVTRSGPSVPTYAAAASSGSEVVAITSGTPTRMARSTNGISWAEVTGHGLNINAQDVLYGGGRFLAVAGGSTTNGKIKTSTDGGLTWSNATHPLASGTSVYGAAYDGVGVYVVVALAGTIKALRSVDSAATFTAATTDITFNPTCVTYGAGLFVAAGLSGEIATSPDGNTWTNRTSVLTGQMGRIRFGGGIFMTAGQGGQIATSPDGINWTRRDVPGITSFWNDVRYNNGVWLIVRNGDTARYSTDGGVTWAVAGTGPSSAYAIDYLPGRWVGLGNSGSIQTADY